jgi:hypothetical protein
MTDATEACAPAREGGKRAPIIDFALRVGIVILAITFAISWLVDTYIPDTAKIKEITHKVLVNREAKLRIDGLVSANPRVSYEISVIREQKNDLAGAVDEMIVALGILERAGARPEVMEPYKRRLDALRAALAATQNPAK